MKFNLKAFLSPVFGFIAKWPGTLGIPIALILWWLSPYLLHSADPVASTFDAGVMQIILFAVICMLVGNEFIFGGILMNFRALFDYYTSLFSYEYSNCITPWQRIVTLLIVYCSLLLCFTVLCLSLR